MTPPSPLPALFHWGQGQLGLGQDFGQALLLLLPMALLLSPSFHVSSLPLSLWPAGLYILSLNESSPGFSGDGRLALPVP